MAAAAVTAICGRRARTQSRVRAVPRGLWRLLVLLGLALIGFLLLDGTAYASDVPSPSPLPAAATATPAEPQAAPVLDQVLDTTEALVPALPVRDLVGVVTTPAAVSAVPAATTTVAEIPAAAAPAIAPDEAADAATQTVGTLGATELASKATKAVAPDNDVVRAPELPELPRLTDIVAPVITETNTQVRSTVDTAVDLVEKLTAPIPLAGSVTQQMGGTTRDVVERTTSLLNVTAYAAAGAVDAVVDQATPILSPVVSPVLQTLTAISQLGVAVASPAASGGVPSMTGYTGDVASAPTTTVAAPSGWADLLLTSQSEIGPGVPPPDATATSTVQSASSIDTTLAVPVSDAGSTVVGNGSGTGSAGGSDMAKVLVELLSRRSPKTVAATTEAPVGPMPGTPLADPGFSPD